MNRALLVALASLLAGCAPIRHDTIVQYSTINALLAGAYDGNVTFAELRRHGDFGLGTFDALDGEMVALDGQFYQVRSDGRVYPVSAKETAPFAVVTFFRACPVSTVTCVESFHALEQWLDAHLSDRNVFHAIRIDGEFTLIKARSVPLQQKPYPPLVDAAKQQTVFTFENVTGTLVGFHMPEFMRELNVPGYHFHFLTKDRLAGGHVLDCVVGRAIVQIDETSRFLMVLPRDNRVDLSQDRRKELDAVEKGTASP